MAIETNVKPLTMSAEEFGKACDQLCKQAEAAPPYSTERADAFDAIGRLFTDQGFRVLGVIWHDVAIYCRRGIY